MTSLASPSQSEVAVSELPFWGMAAIDLRDALSSWMGAPALLVERTAFADDALVATIALEADGSGPSLMLRLVAAPRVLHAVCAGRGEHVAADTEALEMILLELAIRIGTLITMAAGDRGLRYRLGGPSAGSANELIERSMGEIPVTMTYAFAPRGEGILVEARETPGVL